MRAKRWNHRFRLRIILRYRLVWLKKDQYLSNSIEDDKKPTEVTNPDAIFKMFHEFLEKDPEQIEGHIKDQEDPPDSEWELENFIPSTCTSISSLTRTRAATIIPAFHRRQIYVKDDRADMLVKLSFFFVLRLKTNHAKGIYPTSQTNLTRIVQWIYHIRIFFFSLRKRSQYQDRITKRSLTPHSNSETYSEAKQGALALTNWTRRAKRSEA